MPPRLKGATYPLNFPCGCAAGYWTSQRGKKKLLKHPKVMILADHDDGRRVCNCGKVWVLNSVWLEVNDDKT